MKAISEANLPNLVTLWLSFNHITSSGLNYFTQNNWPQLQKLHLAANHFGHDGIAALAKG
jgi:Leucine-rich repeat (LRR) protein